MIALLVITDGRDCVHDTIRSAMANLNGPITHRFLFVDGDDEQHFLELGWQYGNVFIVMRDKHRLGFAGAIQSVWRYLACRPERFVFHLEDDFIFNRPVDLEDMAAVLDAHPHLAQLALRRQPWNDDERAAGGIVEQHPNAYTDHEWRGLHWLEHRLFFTTNPSLYRRTLCFESWPSGPHSEGFFSHRLIEDPALAFGFWGARDTGEWVTHVGHERVGVGY